MDTHEAVEKMRDCNDIVQEGIEKTLVDIQVFRLGVKAGWEDAAAFLDTEVKEWQRLIDVGTYVNDSLLLHGAQIRQAEDSFLAKRIRRYFAEL